MRSARALARLQNPEPGLSGRGGARRGYHRGVGQPLRIIDANANRAREALRVMEDAARFLLDDRPLVESHKSVRHALAEALSRLPGGGGAGLAWRDTAGDVGTSVTTPSEFRRQGMRDVVIAAGKRLTEALRVIEEAAKTLEGGIDVAASIESLRYRAYDLERDLVLAMGTGRGRQWRLCVLITEALCRHHPWIDVARLAIEGGADCLQLREKSLDGGELVARARALVDLARPRGVSVIINDRVDVALAGGADGVHLGQGDMSVRDARRVCGFDLLIGVSTSNLDEAIRARRDGADSCGIGPMFPTTTKRKNAIAGPAYAQAYRQADPPLPPHLAIGGITPANAGEVVEAGARGLAVSAAACGAEDVAGVCRGLVEQISGTVSEPS